MFLRALVDGLVLGSLGEDGVDPRARIHDVLRGAVDGSAPLEPGGVLGPMTSRP